MMPVLLLAAKDLIATELESLKEAVPAPSQVMPRENSLIALMAPRVPPGHGVP